MWADDDNLKEMMLEMATVKEKLVRGRGVEEGGGRKTKASEQGSNPHKSHRSCTSPNMEEEKKPRVQAKSYVLHISMLTILQLGTVVQHTPTECI